MLVPVLLLHTMLVPLMMFPEVKFYNASMTRDADYSAAAKPPVRKNGNHLSG